jgi:sulfoxide reductase heme-binding subunit YedZ
LLYHLAQSTTEDVAHDIGLREIGNLTARIAYAMMCLSLCWGVLTSIGWVNRMTGRQALRSGHMILSSLTIAFLTVHVASYMLLHLGPFTPAQVLVPFYPGNELRYTIGILALEGLCVAALFAGMRRFMTYYRWLWIHRVAYPAFALGIVHAYLGASANGHVGVLWLGGLTLLIPAVTLAMLRFVPAKALATTGLIEDAP